MSRDQIEGKRGEIPGTVLTKEDFDELNGGSRLSDYPEKIEKMRKKYAGNILAQLQINMFDPGHLYITYWKEYSETPPNTARASELKEWFDANGYNDPRLDIDREGIQRIMKRKTNFKS